MAKYNPTKELIRFAPGMLSETGTLKDGIIEFKLTHTDATSTTWSGNYQAILNLESFNRKADEFTEAELLGMIPASIYEVFDHHFDVFAHNPVPRPEDIVHKEPV